MGTCGKIKKRNDYFSKCNFNEASLELFIDDDADAGLTGLQIVSQRYLLIQRSTPT